MAVYNKLYAYSQTPTHSRQNVFQVDLDGIPQSFLGGQVVKVTARLRNCGPRPLRKLSVVCSNPELITWCKTTVKSGSSPDDESSDIKDVYSRPSLSDEAQRSATELESSIVTSLPIGKKNTKSTKIIFEADLSSKST